MFGEPCLLLGWHARLPKLSMLAAICYIPPPCLQAFLALAGSPTAYSGKPGAGVTEAKLAGGSPAEFLALDGRELGQALRGQAGRDALISSTQGGVLSIRDSRWKFIPGSGKPGNAKSEAVVPGNEDDAARDAREQAVDRLFDLLADPAERNNVASLNAEVVQRLKEMLSAEKAKGFNQPLP